MVPPYVAASRANSIFPISGADLSLRTWSSVSVMVKTMLSTVWALEPAMLIEEVKPDSQIFDRETSKLSTLSFHANTMVPASKSNTGPGLYIKAG